jgi:dethiobiotin synthetase
MSDRYHSSRPARLIAVVGTRTDVGKTWVSQALLLQWRARGLKVAARKPVQSFDDDADVTDAERLAEASGEDPCVVCPKHRWYERAMAPPMAADVLNRPRIALDELFGELTWPSRADVGVVETAGGIWSPVAHDGASIDFVRRMDPDEVLLVADAGLNTINAIKLSMHLLDPRRTRVFLNRFDATERLHYLNAEWLAQNEKLTIVTSIDDLV